MHVKDVLTVENVDRDGGLGFAGHHAAIVPCMSGAGSLHDESTDDHKDLLARWDLCRSVLARNEIEPSEFQSTVLFSVQFTYRVDTRTELYVNRREWMSYVLLAMDFLIWNLLLILKSIAQIGVILLQKLKKFIT